MKKNLLVTFALAMCLLQSQAQLKKPADTTIIKSGGGSTPPYVPIPPVIIGLKMTDFSKFTLTPVLNKNVSALEVNTRNVKQKGFSLNINDQQYNFYDNGVYPDKKAGDGIYTSLINEKSRVSSSSSVTIDPNGNSTATARWRIETVPCPKGCKSIIFGTECRVCIKIVWTSN